MCQKTGLKCSICRYHFIQWVKNHNVEEAIKNKTNLFTFFWSCHNDVNKRKGKQILSYDYVYKMYTTQNWEVLLHNNTILNKSLNILLLFKNNKLKEFPSLYSTYWDNIPNSHRNEISKIEKKILNIEKNEYNKTDKE